MLPDSLLCARVTFQLCSRPWSQDGCLLWRPRVIIPPLGQALVFQELHEAHPGATRMKSLTRMFTWWPNIDKDIERHVKHCHMCQVVRDSPPVSPMCPIRWPTTSWTRYIAGPFLGKMFLILVDAHSKWLEAHILPTTTSSSIVECLRKIFCHFWVAKIVGE